MCFRWLWEVVTEWDQLEFELSAVIAIDLMNQRDLVEKQLAKHASRAKKVIMAGLA